MINPKSRLICIIPLLFILTTFNFRNAAAQDLGMSFSFFFPKNGYFSTPISPFSIRGFGINPAPFFSVETGFSLYRMSGLNVKNLPFESEAPLMGPMFTFFVPLEAVLEAQTGNVVFRLKGGGFGFYNFGNHVNYGNMDRAIADHYDWTVANADLDYDNNPGLGYLAGGEIIVYFTRDFGINLEVNYLSGASDLNYRGSITGGSASNLDVISVNYDEAKIDFTGWEISVGILFSN